MIPINRKLKVDVIFFRRKETNYQLTSDTQTKRKEHSGNSLYKLQEAVCEVYSICQDGPIFSTDGKLKVGDRRKRRRSGRRKSTRRGVGLEEESQNELKGSGERRSKGAGDHAGG
jgi:hypothetical protein